MQSPQYTEDNKSRKQKEAWHLKEKYNENEQKRRKKTPTKHCSFLLYWIVIEPRWETSIFVFLQ